MKVLFLDIDGVLNGHEKHTDSPYTTIRPDCVRRLNEVLKATEAKLVISSAWRYMLLRQGRGKPQMTLLGFQYMLHTHGLLFMAAKSGVIGHTCSDEEIPERGHQILAWVAAHEPEKWAVVDDMHVNLGRRHCRKMVTTDGKHGLQKRDTAKLIQLLR